MLDKEVITVRPIPIDRFAYIRYISLLKITLYMCYNSTISYCSVRLYSYNFRTITNQTSKQPQYHFRLDNHNVSTSFTCSCHVWLAIVTYDYSRRRIYTGEEKCRIPSVRSVWPVSVGGPGARLPAVFSSSLLFLLL